MKKTINYLFDWITRLTKWLTIVAACCLAILMGIIFLDIVGTKFFKSSIPGALDISEELMVFLTLFPMAYLAAGKKHINITLLESRLVGTTRFIVTLVQYTIATAITGLITWRVYVGFEKSFQIQQLKGGIDLPTWPANLATVIAFAFLTVIWLLHLLRTMLRIEDEETPEGAP